MAYYLFQEPDLKADKIRRCVSQGCFGFYKDSNILIIRLFGAE